MVKKIETKDKDLRKIVYTFLDLHPEMTSASIVNHFELKGFSRSTLFDILKRKEDRKW